jgi:hypothetical protein
MLIDRETLRAIYETIRAEARAVVAPFTRGGKLDVSSPNVVGHLPPRSGGTGTAAGAEPPLGNPASDGYVLSSTTAGVRSWVAQSGGGLPWFDVTAAPYNATGDGTTDDAAAINAAIAAYNAAGGGVLYFPKPASAYLCGSALTTITQNGWVLGDGSGSSRLNCTSATAALFSATATELVFQGLYLVNTGGATPSAGGGVVLNGASIQVVDFLDVRATGFYDNIDIQVGAAWRMEGCDIRHPIRYGVRVRNTINIDAGDWVIANGSFVSNVAGSVSLRIESSGGGKLANVKFNGSDGTGPARQIDLAASAAGTSILLVANCSFENYTGNGVHLVGPWPQIVIHGCQWGQYDNATGRPIYAEDIDSLIVGDCAFRGASAIDAAPYALEVVDCAHVRLGPYTLYDVADSLLQSGSTDVIDFEGGGGLTTEQVQDTVGAMALAGAGLSVAYDDGAGALTYRTAEPFGVAFTAGGDVALLEDGRIATKVYP